MYRYVLFTNLDNISLNSIWMFTHALLLASDASAAHTPRPQYMLRGFGMSSTWPVFQIQVPSDDYHVVMDEPPQQLQQPSVAEPWYLGGQIILAGPDAPRIRYTLSDQERPLDVVEFCGEKLDDILDNVWSVLNHKTVAYYTAPYIPELTYVPHKRMENGRAR